VGSLAEAIVDLDVITRNVQIIRKSTHAAVMAVVKADGFGHGAVEVARAALAGGATWLGVTSMAEALRLRSAGLDAPMLSWLHRPGDDLTRLIAACVDVGVSTVPHLIAVADVAARSGQVAQIQLKVDTGLSRNGAVAGDWPDLVAWAAKREADGSVRVRGLWSHLAGADQPGLPGVAEQAHALRQAVAAARAAGLTPDLVHLANSAATFAAPDTHFDMCRVGIALYGIGPAVRPAMTLRTTVVNLKRVPAGTGVSYGPRHVTSRPTTLALLPIGYADGVPRSVKGAQVWLGGRRHPVVGTVAMDQIVVDVGDSPVHLGDTAILFGPGGDGEPTVADWAAWAGTNPHEILTGIGSRVERIHIHGED
jgi:alanine racemase